MVALEGGYYTGYKTRYGSFRGRYYTGYRTGYGSFRREILFRIQDQIL